MIFPTGLSQIRNSKPASGKRRWLWILLIFLLPLAVSAGGTPEEFGSSTFNDPSLATDNNGDLNQRAGMATQETDQKMPGEQTQATGARSREQPRDPSTEPPAAELTPTSSTSTGNTAPIKSPKEKIDPVTLEPYILTYKTTLKGIEIESQRHLERTGENTYKAYGKASLMFFGIEEFAVFSVEKNHRIQAEEYFYDRQGMSGSKDFHIVFDWKKGMAINQLKKDPWQIRIQPGMLDMLSHQEQLRLDMALASGPLQGKTFHYDIVKKGKISHYQYRVGGAEVIETEAGPIDCIRIDKIEDDDDRQTRVWLAKNWGYIIVRLDHEEKGSTNTMELVGGTINGKKVTTKR